MTEEINHSYDGGLYAELLSNPTFRNIWSGLEAWQLVRLGNAEATGASDKTAGPSAALTTSSTGSVLTAAMRHTKAAGALRDIAMRLGGFEAKTDKKAAPAAQPKLPGALSPRSFLPSFLKRSA